MPSPSQLRNGGGDGQAAISPPARSPPLSGRQSSQFFHSTVSLQRLRRINTLILLLRLAAFCFSFAATVFMACNNSRSPGSPSWIDHEPFRFVLAANAIVAIYSFAEMGASIWEVLKGSTLLPETLQLWFDFGHDQAAISIALGFVGFLFLAISALFSGFRVGCHLLTGSRFPA